MTINMTRLACCPKCGSVWELDEDAGEKLRCGECGQIFSINAENTLEVDEQALKGLRVEVKDEETAAPNSENDSVSAAEHRVEPAASDSSIKPLAQEPIPEDENGEEADDEGSEPRASSILYVFLYAVLAFILFCVLHGQITKAVPFLKPVYDQVCTKYTCPGFVWSANSSYFDVEAVVVEADELPVVEVRITNKTSMPVSAPLIALELLDNAETPFMTRNLDPADYEASSGRSIPPKATVSVTVNVQTRAPFPPAGARARILDAL